MRGSDSSRFDLRDTRSTSASRRGDCGDAVAEQAAPQQRVEPAHVVVGRLVRRPRRDGRLDDVGVAGGQLGQRRRRGAGEQRPQVAQLGLRRLGAVVQHDPRDAEVRARVLPPPSPTAGGSSSLSPPSALSWSGNFGLSNIVISSA